MSNITFLFNTYCYGCSQEKTDYFLVLLEADDGYQDVNICRDCILKAMNIIEGNRKGEIK
jgi:hypothetical protein